MRLLVDIADRGWWYGLAWRETCWNRASSGSFICCKERWTQHDIDKAMLNDHTNS